MKVMVLFAQRKEAYAGQYAPEALNCITESDHADNPEFITEAKAQAIASGEFEAVVIVTLNVYGPRIDALLNPSRHPLPAGVVSGA